MMLSKAKPVIHPFEKELRYVSSASGVAYLVAVPRDRIFWPRWLEIPKYLPSLTSGNSVMA